VSDAARASRRAALDANATGAGLAIWLASMAAVAGLTELLLLRIATRTAIHIPGIDRLAIVYRIVADGGRLAYYLAVVMLAFGLVAAAIELYRRGHPAAATAVGLVVAAGAAGRLGWLPADLLDALVIVLIVGLAIGVARPLPYLRRLPVLLYATAFTIAGLLSPVGADVRLASEVAAAGAMVVVAGLAMKGADRASIVAGGAVAAVALVALVASPSTARILLLWNTGLAGSLPSVVYAVGCGGVVVAVMRLWRTGRLGPAVGLCLVVVAGIGLHSTYQSALAVLGLAVLTLDPIGEGRTALPSGRASGASSVRWRTPTRV
jgi:hypothetical protein